MRYDSFRGAGLLWEKILALSMFLQEVLKWRWRKYRTLGYDILRRTDRHWVVFSAMTCRCLWSPVPVTIQIYTTQTFGLSTRVSRVAVHSQQLVITSTTPPSPLISQPPNKPLHQQPPRPQNQRGRPRTNPHQPLQRTELHHLHPLPQTRHLLLDPRLGFLDLQLLPLGFFSDAALFEVQVELDGGLGAREFIAHAGRELGEVVGEALVGGERHGCVTGVEGEEFGAEFGEIDFLGVGGAVGVWWVENFSTNEGFQRVLRVKLEGG